MGSVHRYEVLEKYYVRIYDILTRELVRTINILDAIERLEWDEIEEYRFLTRSPSPYMENGELFFAWRMTEFYQDVPASSRINNRWLRMNYLTEEMTVHEGDLADEMPLPNEKERDFCVCLSIFTDLSIYEGEIRLREALLPNNVIERNERNDFIVIDLGFQGVASITLLASLLPEESESLYSRFPGLRQFQGREDLRVQVVLTGYPTAQEILEMFMEDGREISFEGLFLPGSLSIDGEDHDIDSFEDYMRLRSRDRWEVAGE
jgi:hypothetical protein